RPTLALLAPLALLSLACDEPRPRATPGPTAASAAPAPAPAPARDDEHAGMRVHVDDHTSRISSCSSCTALNAFPDSPALSISHAGNGAGVSVWKTGNGAGVLTHGGRIEVTEEGGVIVVASSAHAPAAERVAVPGGVSVVTIEPTA